MRLVPPTDRFAVTLIEVNALPEPLCCNGAAQQDWEGSTVERSCLATVALAAASICTAVSAQEEGDPEAGRLLAEQYCARCHNIDEGGPFKEYPPSFASIAAYRGDDQIWSRTMFPAVHTSMPAMWDFLMPENVTHVLAYMRSIEAEH